MIHRALAMVAAVVAAVIAAGLVTVFDVRSATGVIVIAVIIGATSGYTIGGKCAAPPPGAYLREDPPESPRLGRWVRIFK